MIFDQSSIYEYVRCEYSVEEKAERIDQIYKDLLISSWYREIVESVILSERNVLGFGDWKFLLDNSIVLDFKELISFKSTKPWGKSSSRISLVPPWFQPITFAPEDKASIVVLPKGSGLIERL